REGKKSLPILMAIKLANGKDKKVILKAFGNPKASKNELENAVGVIRSLGIEDEVRKQAFQYASMAEKSLAKYSGSAKTELIDLLDFVVKRSV
ncbi:MAG: polyprenyl synthetase family protein, partial [Nanoarchaeota archaeon]|nr:polyprenyl synthetase family protein [Nanoarchaeota archaeon]